MVEGLPFAELEGRLVPSVVSEDVFGNVSACAHGQLRRLDAARRKLLEKSYSEEDSALAASWCADDDGNAKASGPHRTLRAAEVATATRKVKLPGCKQLLRAAAALMKPGVPVKGVQLRTRRVAQVTAV